MKREALLVVPQEPERDQPGEDEEEPKSQSAQILKLMRERRTEVDKLLQNPWKAAAQLSRPWIVAPIVVCGLFFLIRMSTRGIARSFEGYAFDVAMALLALILVGFIVGHIVFLVALWDAIRASGLIIGFPSEPFRVKPDLQPDLGVFLVFKAEGLERIIFVGGKPSLSA